MPSSAHKKPVVHILYSRRWNVDMWAEKHAQGLEPDKYQYGFDRMEKYGFNVTFCRFPHGILLQKLAGLCARLFKFTFDPFYCIFQLKHFLAADVIINPLDHEGFTLCWLRKHNLFGLRRKKHIFVAVWLPSYVQTCSQRQLKRFKALLSTVDICMYYCENAKNILKEYLDIPEEKLAKMHFGVDADFYTEVEVAEENFILAPGNDSFRDFEILSEVAKALPHETFCLASNIKIKNKIPSNMHYLKLKYNSELLDYYRRAKAILIPIKKDCPTSCGSSVLMEAMLLKKPVIVTATDYMKEAIGNRETAVMVAPGSAEAIVKATQLLHGNPALRKKIGTTARAEALKCFTSEHCMEKIVESINKLLLSEKTRKKTIHILYPANWSVRQWSEDYDKGLVPDRYQYGFNRFNQHGYEVTYAQFPHSKIMRTIGKISRRLFKHTFNPYYFLFQFKYLLKADIVINPLDHEGFTLCWLRNHKLFGLHKKIHLFITEWLPNWLNDGADEQRTHFSNLLRSVDKCLYKGEIELYYLKKHLGMDESKYEKYYFGIDKDFYHYTHSRVDDFIVTAGIDLERDYETLFQAMEKIPCTLYVACQRDLGISIPNNVRIIKLNNHMELLDFYQRAKFFIVPTKKGCIRSSGSTVVKEGMIMGKAVIVSATDYMKEHFKNNETVVFAEPGNVKDMKEKIVGLLQNPYRCAQIGQKAREEALRLHTSDYCVRQLVKTIENMPSKKITVHILYPANWSVDKWKKDYGKGLVPDRYQYGFNRLENYGFKVTYAHFPQSLIMQKFANLTKQIFKYTFNPYYFIFQRKHLRKADVFISPLDPEGLMFCWLRKHKILDLHKKKHIFIPAWLAAWAQDASADQLKMLRSLIATVDVLMYYGESDKRIYKKLLLVPDEKLYKINFGVDTDFFKSSKSSHGGLIFAPGNDVFRDFDTLAEVAAELPQENFLIASPKKLVLNMYPPNLTIKSVSHRELVDFYAQAKAVVVPLKRQCPTASGVTVLKEALLFNKRIIASSSDLIKEFASGWKSHVTLVEPESKESLKEAIQNHQYAEPRLELNEEQKVTLCTEHYMQKLSEIIRLPLTLSPS